MYFKGPEVEVIAKDIYGNIIMVKEGLNLVYPKESQEGSYNLYDMVYKVLLDIGYFPQEIVKYTIDRTKDLAKITFECRECVEVDGYSDGIKKKVVKVSCKGKLMMV